MAGVNSTAGSPTLQLVDRIPGLPTINIPQSITLGHWGSLQFQIETTAGNIQVEGFSNFHCKGNAISLEAAGLLQANWLPGIPGNAKVRQTVVFEGGTARPVVPKNGKKHSLPHICITRLSRNTYEVVVPPTEKQLAFMRDQQHLHAEKAKIENEQIARKADKEREDAYYSSKSLGEFREYCCGHADVALLLINSYMEKCRFTYNKESKE